jgi:hypothetical protein
LTITASSEGLLLSAYLQRRRCPMTMGLSNTVNLDSNYDV